MKYSLDAASPAPSNFLLFFFFLVFCEVSFFTVEMLCCSSLTFGAESDSSSTTLTSARSETQRYNELHQLRYKKKSNVRTLNMTSKSIMLKSLNTNTKQHMNTIITMILLNLYVMLHASLNTTDFNIRPNFKNVPSSVIITCWIRDDV